MSRTLRLLSAAPAAIVITALSGAAWAQEAPQASPPPSANPAPPAAPSPGPITAAPPPATDYAVAATITDDDTAARRVGGAHEPLLDTETTRLTWPNVPLLATGASVFAISYVPAIVGAAVSDRGDDKLYIPVAGPWLTLARGPSETRSEKALLGVDGAVQGLGALMLATSFFIPERTTKNWYLIGSNDLRVAPSAGHGNYGLAAAGRF